MDFNFNIWSCVKADNERLFFIRAYILPNFAKPPNNFGTYIAELYQTQSLGLLQDLDFADMQKLVGSLARSIFIFHARFGGFFNCF